MSGARPSQRAETGPLRADRGRHPAESARPLVVPACESSPFTRKCQRIKAQANTRPSLGGGPGGQTLLLSQPLHFGDYGGLPMKVLWAILDILAIVVLGSGIYLWLKTRDIGFESWLRRLDEPRHPRIAARSAAE